MLSKLDSMAPGHTELCLVPETKMTLLNLELNLIFVI